MLFRSILGLSSGLPKLDEALNGLGGLVFLAGEPGVGKTTLVQSFVLAALRGDPELAVLIYSLDISKHLWFERLLCQEATVDYRTLHHHPMDEEVLRRLAEAEARLQGEILPRLKIIERPQEVDWFSELSQSHNRLVRVTDCCKVLIVIDLFQRMAIGTPSGVEDESSGKPPSELQKDDCRLDAIKRFRKWSRLDNQPCGATVIVVSELRKGEDGRRELSLGDVKGSGRLGFDADTVLLLLKAQDVAKAPSTVPLILRIEKGRDGVVRSDIHLNFHHTVYRFEEQPSSPKKASGSAASRVVGDDDFDPAA